MVRTKIKTRTKVNENANVAYEFFSKMHRNLDEFCRKTKRGETVAQYEIHPEAAWDDFCSGIFTGPNFKIEKIDKYGDNPMLFYKSDEITIFSSYYTPAYLSEVNIGDISFNGIEAVSNEAVFNTMNGIIDYLNSDELVIREKTSAHQKQKTQENN